MASQVLSGSSNVSYTNNTGQNVRIVINFMKAQIIQGGGTSSSLISMSWAGVSVNSRGVRAIGRNLAYTFSSNASATVANNAYALEGTPIPSWNMDALPTELMLAPGQTFATTGIDAYNIVIIPEAG